MDDELDEDALDAAAEAAVSALAHDPVRPARPGVPEESIFLSGWRELMAETACAPLRRAVHGGWSLPTQRDAQVAASFVTWLATNGGSALIHEGRKLQASGLYGTDAFLAAWAVRNARRFNVNSGLRSIEWTLFPAEAERNIADHRPVGHPELSARDLELADHIAGWLGSDAGEAFVKAREREVEAYRSHMHSRRRAASLAKLSYPNEMSPREVEDFVAILRGFSKAAA